MSESDLLRAGMKVVGCFVVIGALYGLAATLYEALGLMYAKSQLSPETQQVLTFFWKWKLSSVVIGVLRLLLGFYLCTGASAFVNMLQEKNPVPPAH